MSIYYVSFCEFLTGQVVILSYHFINKRKDLVRSELLRGLTNLAVRNLYINDSFSQYLRPC